MRGAAAICLGAVGGPEDLNILLERLEDSHPWPQRGAIYALGQLGLAAAAPRIREELRHPDPEVRLAAIWALGRLQDDGARELLVTLLRQIDPTLRRGMLGPLASSGSGVETDAADRCFDTVVQALGRLGAGDEDPFVARALLEARARVPEEELDRPARLPGPELTPGRPPLSLRILFESALPALGA